MYFGLLDSLRRTARMDGLFFFFVSACILSNVQNVGAAPGYSIGVLDYMLLHSYLSSALPGGGAVDSRTSSCVGSKISV